MRRVPGWVGAMAGVLLGTAAGSALVSGAAWQTVWQAQAMASVQQQDMSRLRRQRAQQQQWQTQYAQWVAEGPIGPEPSAPVDVAAQGQALQDVVQQHGLQWVDVPAGQASQGVAATAGVGAGAAVVAAAYTDMRWQGRLPAILAFVPTALRAMPSAHMAQWHISRAEADPTQLVLQVQWRWPVQVPPAVSASAPPHAHAQLMPQSGELPAPANRPTPAASMSPKGRSLYNPFTTDGLRQALQWQAQQTAGGRRWLGPLLQQSRQVLDDEPLSAMALVGVLQNPQGKQAVLATAQGVQVLQAGQALGQDHGRIVHVAEDHIRVRTVVPTPTGDWAAQEALLPLKGRP